MIKRSRTEYSLLNIFTGIIGYIINTILGFICRMFFVRVLSESYLGLNGFLTNFLSMLSLAELGIGSAIIYALYKPISENDEDKIASLMKVYKIAYWTVGIVVALVGICSLPFLKNIIGDTNQIKENVYLIYLIFLFNTASGYFFSYKASLITASQRNYIVIGISYLLTSLQSIIQIVLLINYKSYYPYLFVQTIGTQAYNILISIIVRKEYPYLFKRDIKSISKDEKKMLFKNIKRVTVYKLSGILVNNTDNLVITYFNGLGITGLTSNYTLLVNTLSTLIEQFFGSLTASIGNLNASDDLDYQFLFFKSLNLANFWLYSWAFLGVFLLSSDLVSLFFGEKYIMNQNISLILAINLYMVGMQNAVWTFKNTKGLFKYGQYILLVTAFFNIVGDIVLGKLYGVFGIYLATAISRLLTNTWYEPYVIYKVAFKKNPISYLKRYIKYLILLSIETCCCYVICNLLHFHLLINIILKILICSVIANFTIYLVYHNSEDYIYIRNIVKRVKKIVLRKV